MVGWDVPKAHFTQHPASGPAGYSGRVPNRNSCLVFSACGTGTFCAQFSVFNCSGWMFLPLFWPLSKCIYIFTTQQYSVARCFPVFKKFLLCEEISFFFLFSEIATFQDLYDAPNNQEEKKKLERNSLFFTIVNQIVNSSGSDSKLMTHEALRCEQVNGQVGPAVGK